MLSTHVLSEIKGYCRNMAIMKEGKLKCVDSVANITRTNAKRVKLLREGRQESYIFEGNLNELMQKLAGYDIQDVLIEEPSLDEIFMHFYSETE